MEDVEQQLGQYLNAWRSWSGKASIKSFRAAPAMHFAWKVADELSLVGELRRFLPLSQEVHIGTVDARKIALLVLHTPVEGVPIAQIMQRRPNSTDRLGLDHVAFWCADMATLKQALAASNYQWEEQRNDAHIWVSVWWSKDRLEAKFFDHTTLDLGSRELSEISKRLKEQWT